MLETGSSDTAALRGAGVIAGHSHIMCFGVPLRSPDGRIALVPVEKTDRSFLCLNGPFPRDDACWTEVERLATSHRLFLHWRGNQHMAQHLFASDPIFDFVLSERPDLPIIEGAVIIPELMLIEKFTPSFDRLEAILRNIGRAGRGVVICGTPPPKESVDIIRAALAREKGHFEDLMSGLGMTPETVAITPTMVLYKMWRLLQRMMREIADAHGVQYAAVPTQAFSATGFLREEFWSPDVTHANRTFGRLLLTSYRDFL